MGNIVVQQDPVAEAISSIPDLIFKARQLKSQEAQQNVQNQIALDNAEMQRSNYEYERTRREEQDGTLAGGYRNNDINDYFYNLSYDSGGFDTTDGIAWEHGEHSKVPTFQEALTNYKGILAKSGKQFNSTYDMPLFEQYYQGMMQAKWNRFSGEITGLEDANYTEDEISNAIASDPVLRHNMSQFKKVGPQSKEAKAFLAPYSPHLAETGLMGDVGPVGMGVAGATAYSLGKVGFDWANATPDDILLEAKTKFTDLIKADKDAIADAKKMLKDAKSPGDKKAAQELLKEARQNLKTTAQKGKTEYQKLVKENKRWNKLSKGEWGKRLKHFKTLRGFAPTLLGETTGWAAELIGGEKAGAVVKGGTAAAVGGAQGMSIGRFILKKLAAKSPAMFAKAGIAAAADGPFPFGEAVALALTLGTSYSTITDAINEWKQANRVTR